MLYRLTIRMKDGSTKNCERYADSPRKAAEFALSLPGAMFVVVRDSMGVCSL